MLAYLTDKLCSPMNMNNPASTLVGVKPSTFINGGLTNANIAPACRNADHRCSYTRLTSQVCVFLSPSTIIVDVSCSACIRDSECRGACGNSPFEGGIPRIPQIAVVVPSNIISHANPPVFCVPYRSIVQIIELTSWSKKNKMVMIIPGIIAPKIHGTGNFQNSTKNLSRSGDVGLKVSLTGRVILSRCASSPMYGRPMKRMMDIAAAYSVRRSRT